MESANNGLHKKGWAQKKGDVIPQWNKRYLICDPYTCRLLYYKEKPKDESETVPRGSLALTDCTVTITSTEPGEDQCRFLITSRDRKLTYNLQVADSKELKDWTHSILLLSKLGTVRKEVLRENLADSTKTILMQSAQMLLRGYQRRAADSRDGLKRVAEQKWKAKCRLMEVLKQLIKGETELQNKYGNLQIQEKELREKMHFLIQKEFFLQDEVGKSNSIQEKVVQAFYANDRSIERRAEEAMKRCIPGNPSTPFDFPRKSKHGSSTLHETVNATDSRNGKKITLPPVTNFREEMFKLLLLYFPSLVKKLPRYLSHFKSWKGDHKQEQSADDRKIEEDLGSKLSDNEKTLQFFHSYFTKVHVAQEERLVQVRTQCQAKFHKLKFITRQRDLISREQDELKWIIGEIKRAISRLTKEGVPLGPGENDADIGQGNLARDGSAKESPVPIRAHRATWSESSDVIFRLNFSRQEQYERTQELEVALTLRESLREFIETLEHTDEDVLEKKIRLVESSISSKGDAGHTDLGLIAAYDSIRDDDDDDDKKE